jgi:hypothetical protein
MLRSSLSYAHSSISASMRSFGKPRMRFSNSRLTSSLIAALPSRAPAAARSSGHEQNQMPANATAQNMVWILVVSRKAKDRLKEVCSGWNLELRESDAIVWCMHTNGVLVSKTVDPNFELPVHLA